MRYGPCDHKGYVIVKKVIQKFIDKWQDPKRSLHQTYFLEWESLSIPFPTSMSQIAIYKWSRETMDLYFRPIVTLMPLGSSSDTGRDETTSKTKSRQCIRTVSQSICAIGQNL
jgi:hypothetical protein